MNIKCKLWVLIGNNWELEDEGSATRIRALARALRSIYRVKISLA